MSSEKEAVGGDESLVEVISDPEREKEDGDQLIQKVDEVYKKFKEVLLEEKRSELKNKLESFEENIKNYVLDNAQSFEHVKIDSFFEEEDEDELVAFNNGEAMQGEIEDDFYDYLLDELLSGRDVNIEDNLLAQMENRISQLSENVEFFSEENIDKINALFEKFNIFNLEINEIINMKIVPPKPKGVRLGIQQFIKDLEQFLD